MKKHIKIWLGVLLAIAVIVVLTLYLRAHTVDILQPAGEVGRKERGLMVFGLLLSVIVVVPTFGLAIFIAVRYREGNDKPGRKYTPDWDRSRLFESIWWGIPIIIIGILSVVAWQSAHSLDPYKSLASSKKPITIQVVALDWKWLFIYPQQHIATVNHIQIPMNTPVDFQITSDTVMNSFWIPSLGGQIYAMPGMNTELHLMADKAGTYNGSSANISGSGFAGMRFTATASSGADFNAWVKQTQQARPQLTAASYIQLAKPSKDNQVAYYGNTQSGLYDDVMMQYMMPGMTMSSMEAR